MRFKWVSLVVVALVGATGWAVSGCGTSPLAPANLPSSGTASALVPSPPILTVSPEGGVGYTLIPSGDAHLGSGTSGGLGISASGKVDGDRGGTLTCGRLIVTIPPRAFAGTAIITVTIPDRTVLQGDLSISPASANNFAVPVKLSVDLSNLAVDPTTLVVYWYDPAAGVWRVQPTTAALSPQSISTSLRHFSKYGAGKAGW
jgi:hypothetical protein